MKLRAALSTVTAAIGAREVLVFGGLAATCYGLALVYPPAAWIVGGTALFTLGMRA